MTGGVPQSFGTDPTASIAGGPGPSGCNRKCSSKLAYEACPLVGKMTALGLRVTPD